MTNKEYLDKVNEIVDTINTLKYSDDSKVSVEIKEIKNKHFFIVYGVELFKTDNKFASKIRKICKEYKINDWSHNINFDTEVYLKGEPEIITSLTFYF